MKYYCFLILIVFILAGCQPSVKNETYAFKKNQQKIDEYMNTYPSFKQFLNELIKKATDVFEQSSTLEEEKDKALKMREANRLIQNDKLFSKIQTYEKKIIDTERKREDLRVLNNDKYRTRIQTTLEGSLDNMNNANNILHYSRPLNYNDAVYDVEKAVDLLLRAESLLDETIKYIKTAERTPGVGNSSDNPQIDDSMDSDGSRDARATEEPYQGGREQTATEEPYEGGR